MGAFTAIYLIAKVGRRTIFLIGQGGIAICLLGIAIISYIDAPISLLLLICLVSFIF